MTNPTENAAMWFKVAAVLAGLLGTAFFAWAGVVWSAWADMREVALEIHKQLSVISVRIEHVEREQARAETYLERHIAEPWHDTAGDRIRELEILRNNGRGVVAPPSTQ